MEVVTVEPDFQEQAGGVRRAALGGLRDGQAQGGQIELIDKFAQEADGVIGSDPVFQGGRKKELLSVIRGDGLWHCCLRHSAQKDVRVLRQSQQQRPTTLNRYEVRTSARSRPNRR